ncbi:Disulfide bond reductase DsbH precursor [Symmachiella macrocystis]|uniref:Disulfide bond reductase DsbH n=1 Tax=Symmachiella macrocystis TaxID=2527985 RepID=A0A5C6B4G2_9PLAN|nr:thioredoxin fold domain-containing protein [Symmachiella macrocystis]TWU07053.1 Disulfide bond reductase DsbH precursor [Symmachiella macrocystis]
MDRRPLAKFCLALLVCFTATTAVTAAEKTAVKKVDWQPNLTAAHKLSLKTGKPILLVFGADWCFFCHKLERETLNEANMAKFINNNFIAVKLDLEKDEKVAKILKVKSLPATIVVNSDADMLANIVGYQKSGSYAKNLRNALRVHQELRQVSGEKATTTK